MNYTHRLITTASAIALAAIAITTITFAASPASAAGTPACPSSWPSEPQQGAVPAEQYGRISQDGFYTDSNGDSWYVIRSTDSNGNTTAHAYQADDRYRLGYRAASPDETCYMKLRKPGDTTDAENPQQVIFPKEREEQDQANTGTQTSANPPATLRQILNNMTPDDRAAAVLCLLHIAGNTDADAFLDDPANVQAAIDAGCVPSR